MPRLEEEYSQVRDLLDYPLFQRPNPHQIFAELIRQWQFMVNQLNNTRRPWTVPQTPTTITSVAGQAEYLIIAADFGKPLFVYRELDNDILLPVPFADYASEIHNQSYEFWIAPLESGLSPVYSGEKVSFYRTPTGSKLMRIYPVPEESGNEYKVVYASGYQDLIASEKEDETILPEWSDYRCLRAALKLLGKCEWEGLTRAENADKRREMKSDHLLDYSEQKAEFENYISNVQHEPPGEVGYWYEL
jgi:hypothetical protein